MTFTCVHIIRAMGSISSHHHPGRVRIVDPRRPQGMNVTVHGSRGEGESQDEQIKILLACLGPVRPCLPTRSFFFFFLLPSVVAAFLVWFGFVCLFICFGFCFVCICVLFVCFLTSFMSCHSFKNGLKL